MVAAGVLFLLQRRNGWIGVNGVGEGWLGFVAFSSSVLSNCLFSLANFCLWPFSVRGHETLPHGNNKKQQKRMI
jgi:hypothetical protein